MTKETKGPTLHKHEGKDVVTTSIKVTKAGDGLSAALDMEPREIKIGETGYLLLQWTCSDVNFKPTKPGLNVLDRKHTLVTLRAMFVDGDTVAASLDAHEMELRIMADEQRVKDAERKAEEDEIGR